jgi:hypothetical protein
VIDHIFICTNVGAPAAREFQAFGLVERAPNRHPGQGTANRRFFFCDAMLELDPVEAQSEQTRATRLWERWPTTGRNASSFGIIHQRGVKNIQSMPPAEHCCLGASGEGRKSGHRDIEGLVTRSAYRAAHPVEQRPGSLFAHARRKICRSCGHHVARQNPRDIARDFRFLRSRAFGGLPQV